VTDARTVDACIARALGALDHLEARGQEVADEWQYVTDLSSAWRARLAAVAAEQGSDTVSEAVAIAVDTAADEADLVDDPHRAIDWLSTLPQVVLAALGQST
jgi:hypothetical protein